MRAAVIEQAGSPPRLAEREHPPQRPGTVAIAVSAAPITPLDRLCASGTSYFGVPSTPYVPGVQGVGVREHDGTPVWFATAAGMAPGDGSMREHASVPEADVVALPPGADPALVAALGLSAVAAWMALTWRGELAAGERVLVLGAGGVVGQAAVQLARIAGAAAVVAAARSAQGRRRAADLGADATVALEPDDGVDGLAERMRAACGGPVDLVIDPLFGVPAAAALCTLGEHGRLVHLGSSAGEVAPLGSAVLRSRSLRVIGYTNNALTPRQRGEALTFVAELAAAGRLTAAFEPVPLDDVTQAWTRTANGRVVLVP